MSQLPYLLRLNLELADGLARVPEATRAGHAAFLSSRQNPDGGYSGREGESDLYYTGFALRGLGVLGALAPEICERAAGFLRQCLTREASVVDFFSLLYSCALLEAAGGPEVLAAAPTDWPERVMATLEALRTADGGYAKMNGGISGSTYHTFLVALSYQLLDKPIPNPNGLAAFIHSRSRDDGGYVEIAPMRRSGTNPTAAAVGVLQILDDCGTTPALLSDEIRQRVSDFLAEMPSFEGGLRANGRAPLADLLSTFTGMWTLRQLSSLDRLDQSMLREYVESVELPTGGFRGGVWDEQTDVEYTFYGLGCMALLA